MKKIIIGGILAGVVMLVVGFIFGSLSADMYITAPRGIFKEMNLTAFVIYDLIVGLIFAYVYSIIKSSVPKGGIQKGLIFGLILWAIGTVPGLGITYVTMNIRNKLLLVWLISGLVGYLAAGATIALVDEKVK